MQVKTFPGMQFLSGAARAVDDALAVEAVLQIKVNGIGYTTTVRTPGEDEFLARGLLYTEQVIVDHDAELAFHAVADPATGIAHCLDIVVHPRQVVKDIAGRRSSMSSASCGFCGIRDPDELALEGLPLEFGDAPLLQLGNVSEWLHRMKQQQDTFTLSGGCHAAAGVGEGGAPFYVHEDIGRHNAVDKVVGHLLSTGELARTQCLIVSGRVSYEIVFKAYRAGIPVVIAVSAPSSLAVEMADEFGITLIAFCREGRATVYTHPARVAS